jgi:hypothetical protein
MSVSCVCCLVEVSARGRSLVGGVLLCEVFLSVIEERQVGGSGPLGAAEPQKKKRLLRRLHTFRHFILHRYKYLLITSLLNS